MPSKTNSSRYAAFEWSADRAPRIDITVAATNKTKLPTHDAKFVLLKNPPFLA